MPGHTAINWNGILAEANQILSFYLPIDGFYFTLFTFEGKFEKNEDNDFLLSQVASSLAVSSTGDLWVSYGRRFSVFPKSKFTPSRNFDIGNEVITVQRAGDCMVVLDKVDLRVYDSELHVKTERKSNNYAHVCSSEYIYAIDRYFEVVDIFNISDVSKPLGSVKLRESYGGYVLYMGMWLGKLVLCFEDGIELYDVSLTESRLIRKASFKIVRAKVIGHALVLASKSRVIALYDQKNLQVNEPFEVSEKLTSENVDFAIINTKIIITTCKSLYNYTLPGIRYILLKW